MIETVPKHSIRKVRSNTNATAHARTAAVRNVGSVFSRKPTQLSWATAACLVGSDVTALFVPAMLIATFKTPVVAIMTLAITIFAFASVGGLYSAVGLSPAEELKQITVGSALGHLFALGALFQHSSPAVLLGGVIAAWLLALALVPSFRTVVRAACATKSWWGTPVVVLGSGENLHRVFRHIERNKWLGLKVVGVFEPANSAPPEWAGSAAGSAPLHCAAGFAEQYGVSHALLVADGTKPLDKEVAMHISHYRNLLLVADLPGVTSILSRTVQVGGLAGMQLSHALDSHVTRRLKRALDILISATALIVLLPLLALLWLAVRLSSPGPVFYGQKRIGAGNMAFKVWKFRSMRQDADAVLQRHLETDPEARKEWERDFKLKKDVRVTPIGNFLRKTSLDELPQLWNVLVGDMSLVGPRPIVSAEISRYGSAFEAYTRVQPGITGLWQVSGRNNTTYAERVEFDEHYVRNWSIWLDLYILGRTVKTVLLREGAY